MTLSQALKEKQGDQSLRALAKELGVAVGTAEGWVKGWRTPDLENIPRIANYLGLTVADLVEIALSEDTGVSFSSLVGAAA